MHIRTLALAALTTAAFAVPALAHHSFAMFDADKTVTVKGVVKEFEWVNPHSWLRVTLQDQAPAAAADPPRLEAGQSQAGRSRDAHHASAARWFAWRSVADGDTA